MEINDPLVLVYTRNAFYRRLYYLAFAAYILSVIVIVILSSVLVYLYRHPTRPLFFATDNVGRLIHVVPVNIPNMTFDEVTAWTNEAIETSFSWDYINYRAQLQNAEKYFTSAGWNQFMNTVKASNNLVALVDRQYIIQAKVVGQGKLDRQGILGGSFAWKFTDIPMLVTYSMPPFDEQHQFSNALNVTIIVQRQQALQGYKGLGVVQMIATLAQAPNSNVPQELSFPQDQSSIANQPLYNEWVFGIIIAVTQAYLLSKINYIFLHCEGAWLRKEYKMLSFAMTFTGIVSVRSSLLFSAY